MIYNVILSDDAYRDLANLSDVIKFKFHAPITAFKYGKELRVLLESLSTSATIYQIQTNPFIVRQYGNFVRRVNYKKMAVLYSVYGNTVYILRVIPQSTIAN